MIFLDEAKKKARKVFDDLIGTLLFVSTNKHLWRRLEVGVGGMIKNLKPEDRKSLENLKIEDVNDVKPEHMKWYLEMEQDLKSGGHYGYIQQTKKLKEDFDEWIKNPKKKK